MRIYARAVRSRGARPDWAYIAREMGHLLDSEVKPLLLEQFNRVVADWHEDNRPQFCARKRISRDSIKLYVYPSGENKWLWILISITGAKPHPIVVRRSNALAFLWNGPGSYLPKTWPVGNYGGPGTVENGKMVFFQHVAHPGFVPRLFEKSIAEENKARITRIIENGFRRIIRRLAAVKRR